ncbi:hypothetical protein EJB05_41902 [Eragrostis curvula]|uniref:Uncharacterized protein n=1 Tax=Eragrostis curvula TaxID=38414 RepID=A0A5J9TBA4_9POAL|nr:hypothetical protein EJB05_41902 [Eragrostis curvula]
MIPTSSSSPATNSVPWNLPSPCPGFVAAKSHPLPCCEHRCGPAGEQSWALPLRSCLQRCCCRRRGC